LFTRRESSTKHEGGRRGGTKAQNPNLRYVREVGCHLLEESAGQEEKCF